MPLPLPDPDNDVVVIAAPGNGPGNWVGAPSVLRDGDGIVLAYRVRRPVEDGRGIGTIVARSADGTAFETVAELRKETFGAESLERPALVRSPAGPWQLYVSCATPGTKHWRVDLVESTDLAGLAAAAPTTVLAGSDLEAHKDPVVHVDDGRYRMWLCVHPLDTTDATDRMWTDYLESRDGRTWTRIGTALAPTANTWDSRGARLTDIVVVDDTWHAWYDGRASASENFDERTGLASGPTPHSLRAAADGPVAQSPHADHPSLRYLSYLPASSSDCARLYYELATAGGSHEIRMHAVC